MIYEELLALFAEQLEKQEQLSKLTAKEFLHSYGYSDVHSIAFIGNTQNPNVTKLANHLKMTRGAASKIMKRLLQQNLIETYTKENNKKEKYFCLTTQGQKIYDEHAHRHQLWADRDIQFFKNYTSQQLKDIMKFMQDYNQYLEEQIYVLSQE